MALNINIGLTQMKIFCSKQIFKLIKWFSRGVFISDVCSRFFFMERSGDIHIIEVVGRKNAC